jgi:hypothetical protein
VQPEQPDTPAADTNLPIAQPIRPAAPKPRRPRPDPVAEAARLRRLTRATLIAIAVALTAVFVAAFRIHPYDEDGNPRTMSTHTQLGMPPCNFVVLTGKPCPSCGMTTSFALLVRGEVGASARANWVGSIICALWALTLVWAVASGIWGKALFVPHGRGEVVFTVIVGVILTLMLARWTAVLISG